MSGTRFSIVVHGHQPPGNFDSVFRRGVAQCYLPFFELLEEFPAVRLTVHFSGSLLEWLERNDPRVIELLQRLVARGQVEPAAAGLFEPVLALLPTGDRVNQLQAHRAMLRRLFGVDTHTGWLTERIWMQEIAASLHDGGIDIVPLDDLLQFSESLGNLLVRLGGSGGRILRANGNCDGQQNDDKRTTESEHRHHLVRTLVSARRQLAPVNK